MDDLTIRVLLTDDALGMLDIQGVPGGKTVAGIEFPKRFRQDRFLSFLIAVAQVHARAPAKGGPSNEVRPVFLSDLTGFTITEVYDSIRKLKGDAMKDLLGLRSEQGKRYWRDRLQHLGPFKFSNQPLLCLFEYLRPRDIAFKLYWPPTPGIRFRPGLMSPVPIRFYLRESDTTTREISPDQASSPLHLRDRALAPPVRGACTILPTRVAMSSYLLRVIDDPQERWSRVIVGHVSGKGFGALIEELVWRGRRVDLYLGDPQSVAESQQRAMIDAQSSLPRPQDNGTTTPDLKWFLHPVSRGSFPFVFVPGVVACLGVYPVGPAHEPSPAGELPEPFMAVPHTDPLFDEVARLIESHIEALGARERRFPFTGLGAFG